MNKDVIAMTAYKMNSNPAFHCLALAVMLALSVQAEDEIQGPTIKGVALEEEAVLLDVDFSNPFVWEEIQFKSIKTFPNIFAHAAVDKPQLELVNLSQAWWTGCKKYDFIMLGQYEVLDPHTIKATFLGGPKSSENLMWRRGLWNLMAWSIAPSSRCPNSRCWPRATSMTGPRSAHPAKPQGNKSGQVLRP